MEDGKGFGDKMVDNIDDVTTAEKGGAYESKAELERLYKIHGPDGLDEDGHPKRTGDSYILSAGEVRVGVPDN